MTLGTFNANPQKHSRSGSSEVFRLDLLGREKRNRRNRASILQCRIHTTITRKRYRQQLTDHGIVVSVIPEVLPEPRLKPGSLSLPLQVGRRFRHHHASPEITEIRDVMGTFQ